VADAAIAELVVDTGRYMMAVMDKGGEIECRVVVMVATRLGDTVNVV